MRSTPEGGLREPFADVLETIGEILDREAEPDEALRKAISLLPERVPRYTWVGLHFVEDEALVLGPEAGSPGMREARIPAEGGPLGAAVASGRSQPGPEGGAAGGASGGAKASVAVPVLYDGSPVAVIDVQSRESGALGPDDVVFLERVAELVSSHCLVGWDTGGAPWSDAG